MERTKNRPLPTNQVDEYEALLFALSIGSVGLMILYFLMNPLSCLLGALAMVLYVLAYTPLKRITPFSVFVGAFPGAIPPLIGYVAATGKIGVFGLILFGIQFLWQFPHFWTIAWLSDEDYRKAGFKMLPSLQKDKYSALQVLIYTFSLVPASFFLYAFKTSSLPATIIVCLASFFIAYQSLQLYKTLQNAEARKLMFGSFIYLPLVQLVILFDRLFTHV